MLQLLVYASSVGIRLMHWYDLSWQREMLAEPCFSARSCRPDPQHLLEYRQCTPWYRPEPYLQGRACGSTRDCFPALLWQRHQQLRGWLVGPPASKHGWTVLYTPGAVRPRLCDLLHPIDTIIMRAMHHSGWSMHIVLPMIISTWSQ